METEIYLHKIKFNWDESGGGERPLDDSDIKHIKNCIENGFREGELNQVFTNYDKKTNEPFDDEVRGWWSIVK